MIVLARYCRNSRIPRKKKNKSRNSLLFDKVYGIWRDHCRIEWTRWRLQKWRWYIIRWETEHYTDSKWENKISVSPKGRLCIFPYLSEHQRCVLRMYKNRIRKKYNIYIKTPFYFYKARIRKWYLKMLKTLNILSW